MASHKVIISCAVVGSIHTPSMSPPLPVMPAEIAGSALRAAGAGTNAQQGTHVSNIIEASGSRSQLRPRYARFLELKGGDKVAFRPQHTVR
jgi:uncharacterized protein (DUF849 family)